MPRFNLVHVLPIAMDSYNFLVHLSVATHINTECHKHARLTISLHDQSLLHQNVFQHTIKQPCMM